MEREIVGAIDVGSHALRMKIGEIDEEGNFRELENLRKIVNLGHDAFTEGRVGFDTVEKVCVVLEQFKYLLDTYGVKKYKALATSALRESSNRSYIIDQIKLKSGLNVQVIDNSQEQFLTHKAVKDKMFDYNRLIKEGAVIVVIGAGSMQITLYKNGELISSQNVKMGALRIKEVLSKLETETIKYQKILAEYILVNLEGVDFFDSPQGYENFIAVGGEISVIQKIIAEIDGIKDSPEYIGKKRFIDLFETLKNKTSDEMAYKYGVKKERASIIIPSMMLFNKFLKWGGFDSIIVPNISLTDGIIRELYEETFQIREKQQALRDIVTSAKTVAEKYHYNAAHGLEVREKSMLLFDELFPIHGLKSERILLEVAAILHDIGKFVSLEEHYIHSYDIIRSIELYGLSKEEMQLVACVTLYHAIDLPNEEQQHYRMLSENNKVLISKLGAILRIADALDRSHKQKISIQCIKIRNRKLVIEGVSEKNTKLEEWTFKNKSVFFQEVFGLMPVLKIKKEII